MNILLVEDQSNYAFIVREMLHQKAVATVVSVQRLDQALDHLAQQAPELILLDLSLPDSRGLDTLIRLRQLSGEIPIIVLTATRDEQLAIEAVRRGAQDYLVKDEIDKRGLIRAIRYAIERGNAEHKYRELVESIDAIVWEADPVTWRFTFVSKAAEKILGYPIERWLSEPNFWVNLIHPDDRARTVEDCQRQVEKGDNHQFEYRAVALDGRVVWLRDMVRILTNESGQPINLRGVTIDITRSKEADAERQKNRYEIQSLQEIGQKVLNDGNDSEALDNILDLAISFGGYDVGAIRLLNAKGDIDHVIFRGYENPDSIRMLSDPHTHVQGHVRSASLSQILATREANVFEDIQSREGLEGFKREGIRSAVVVPIGTKDEVLGILQVGSRNPSKFPSNQVRLLEALGSHIGVVVQKTRLYEESRAQFGQLQTIRQFEQAMVSTLDLEDVLKVLLDDIEAFFRFPIAISVHLVDPDKQSFDYVTGRHFVGRNLTAGNSINQGLFGVVLRSPAPIEIAVLANDPRTTRLDFVRQEGFVSCLAIALNLRQEAVGVLAVRTWEEHKFSASEIHYLDSVASHAAIALHNARLYAEVEKQSRELAALFDVTTAATQSLDLQTVMRAALQRITEIFAFDATAAYLVNKARDELKVCAAYDDPSDWFASAGATSFELGQGIPGPWR